MARRRTTDEAQGDFALDSSSAQSAMFSIDPIEPMADPEPSPEQTIERPSGAKRRAKGTGNILSVRLLEDGSIDTEHMRGSTMQRLKSAVGKSNIIASPAEQQAGFAILVPPAYRLLGAIESLVASRVTGIPREQVVPIYTYTDQEISALTDPTASVLVKYGGDWTSEHLEELTLLLTFLAIQQERIARLHELQTTLAAVKQDSQVQPAKSPSGEAL